MGVDAVIVAVEAKRYLYFDRRYNFVRDCSKQDPDFEHVHEIYKKLERKEPVTSGEVGILAMRNIIHWLCQGADDNHRAEWNRKILCFKARHKGDKFIVVSDHDSPDYRDMARANGWTEETVEI